MTKKKVFVVILFVLTLVVLAVCAGCARTVSEEEFDLHEVMVNGKVDEEALAEAYRDDRWNGKFVSADGHCASVEDGNKLWIDCREAWDSIVDAVPSESQIDMYVLESTTDGTWLEDGSTGEIRLDKKGETVKRIVIPFQKFYTVKLAESLIVRADDTVLVYDLNGVVLRRIDAVTDMTVAADGSCDIATWGENNYIVLPNGEIVTELSKMITCRRTQAQVESMSDKDIDSTVVKAILNYENGWNGDLKVLDGHFVLVDYYGDIIVDNKTRGNVHLGYGYALTDDGVNVMYAGDAIYVAQGTKLTKYSAETRGADKSWQIPANKGIDFEWIDDDCAHLLLYKEDGVMDYVCVNFVDGSVRIFAENVTSANTAYDSVYYMGSDRIVYKLDWKDELAKPVKFCENAYCVSSHTDEGEGAIVPEYLTYGFRARIYSPYSPDYTK